MTEQQLCNQYKKYQEYFKLQTDKTKLYDVKSYNSWVHGDKGIIDEQPTHTSDRRCVDFNTCHSEMNSLHSLYYPTQRIPYAHSNYSFTRYLQPPLLCCSNPAISVATKFVHTSINKSKCPVYCMRWTPDGRRLVTGSNKGEFTLWNGLQFNFISISTAHHSAVRCMCWSHDGVHLLSGEEGSNGACEIKYWNSSLTPVQEVSEHTELIREISFAPTDTRFVSCSDDKTVKVWDFANKKCEVTFEESETSVFSVDWHPTDCIILSSSKGKVRIWDARTKEKVGIFSPHNNEINKVRWNRNGKWFLTCSKDHKIKLHDIRMINQPLMTFSRHDKDVTTINWHPINEDYFVSGGANEIPVAHDGAVWDLQWHPIGHLLATCSHDQTTKFWCRDRPGDDLEIKKYQGTNREYDPIIPMIENEYESPFTAQIHVPNEYYVGNINGLRSFK
ncbi:Polyadenylation factor subunit [Entamoeba marina]